MVPSHNFWILKSSCNCKIHYFGYFSTIYKPYMNSYSLSLWNEIIWNSVKIIFQVLSFMYMIASLFDTDYSDPFRKLAIFTPLPSLICSASLLFVYSVRFLYKTIFFGKISFHSKHFHVLDDSWIVNQSCIFSIEHFWRGAQLFFPLNFLVPASWEIR